MPLLVDLAAMRSAVARMGKNPKMIEPLVPVDLVVDHSVQVDFSGSAEALAKNLEIEFTRNRERYQFLKWGMQAFETFKVVPPGIGIVHQVNLEYLAKGVLERRRRASTIPTRWSGTDSHTTMINGLGIVGWGVGGIEAEAGMLGQPVYFLTPGRRRRAPDGRAARGRHGDRPGAHGHPAAAQGEGRRQVRRILRPGRGGAAGGRPRDDRQHGAGVRRDDGLLPDRRGVRELSPRHRPRAPSTWRLYEAYYQAQGLWGMPKKGEIDYSQDIELDLATVVPSVAGPEAAAGPDRAAEAEAGICRLVLHGRSRKMASARRPRSFVDGRRRACP